MTLKKRLFPSHVVLLFLSIFAADLAAQIPVKNVILMVPDGLGLSYVTATRIKKYGVDGQRLFFERLEQIGYQRTHSADSVVTDSAAAASAWAVGAKFSNGEISQHGQGGGSSPTILELAQSLGKGTGLVATSSITHATPAAFGAHIHSRWCHSEIARQYIMVSGVDVLLGGGLSSFKTATADPCGTSGDWITKARERGYKVTFTKQKLMGFARPAKLLGLFADKGMTPRHQRSSDSTEPSLAEMTQKALDCLQPNPNGFFLMVEGSQIDWAGHAHDLNYLLGEVIDFDLAVKVVLNWLKASGQAEETLLIVSPDHETGGFMINGPHGEIYKKKGQKVDAGWTSDSHTGQDTLVWSQGPYSEYLGRALDNTDLFYVMKAAFLGLTTVEFKKPEY